MNPIVKKIKDKTLRQDAIVSVGLNFKRADACPEDVLSRILWRAMRGTVAPYPAWAVTVLPDDDDD